MQHSRDVSFQREPPTKTKKKKQILTRAFLIFSLLAWNTFADASLAVLPATIFWKLKLSLTRKVQLSIVFGLNILTSVCSGIKTQYLRVLHDRDDFTWGMYDIFVWVTGELFLMVFCGTVPTLGPTLGWIQRTIGNSFGSEQEADMQFEGRGLGLGTAVVRRGCRQAIETEMDHELEGQIHVLTETTVETRRRTSLAESEDKLMPESLEETYRIPVDIGKGV